MRPTIVSRKAGNWVDRGESPLPVLTRILAHYFDKHDAADLPWLEDLTRDVFGMVAADATEINVAGYLRSVARGLGLERGQPPATRMVAVALWHTAKAGLVRDFAERVLRGDIPVNAPTEQRLSDWLAERLLTPSELEALERETDENAEPPSVGI